MKNCPRCGKPIHKKHIGVAGMEMLGLFACAFKFACPCNRSGDDKQDPLNAIFSIEACGCMAQGKHLEEPPPIHSRAYYMGEVRTICSILLVELGAWRWLFPAVRKMAKRALEDLDKDNLNGCACLGCPGSRQ